MDTILSENAFLWEIHQTVKCGSIVCVYYTMLSESIHTPWLIPHFVVLQSRIIVDLIVIFVNNLQQTIYNFKVEEKNLDL